MDREETLAYSRAKRTLLVIVDKFRAAGLASTSSLTCDPTATCSPTGNPDDNSNTSPLNHPGPTSGPGVTSTVRPLLKWPQS